MEFVPDIKLIRTDIHFDLSQKAEKRYYKSELPYPNNSTHAQPNGQICHDVPQRRVGYEISSFCFV
jgi:hypothetical protein